MKRLLLLLAFPLVFVETGAARAGECGDAGTPFNDLTIYDIFCTEATWAKNAGITLGCGPGIFCPGDPVSRAQMVLFLRRLAVAAFPEVILAESSAAPSGDLDTAPGVTACTTVQYAVPPEANGRLWHAHAVVSMQGGAADADVQLGVSQLLFGASGPSFPMVSPPVVHVPAGQWRNASVEISSAFMFPGASHSWRINLTRSAGSATTGELAGLRCQLKIVHAML